MEIDDIFEFWIRIINCITNRYQLAVLQLKIYLKFNLVGESLVQLKD